MPGSLEYKGVHYVLSNDNIEYGDKFVYADKQNDRLYRVDEILGDDSIQCNIQKVLWHYTTNPTMELDVSEYIYTKAEIIDGDYIVR